MRLRNFGLSLLDCHQCAKLFRNEHQIMQELPSMGLVKKRAPWSLCMMMSVEARFTAHMHP